MKEAKHLAAIARVGAVSSGLVETHCTYRDGSRLAGVHAGRALRRALASLPQETRDRIETTSAQAMLASPGVGIAVVYACSHGRVGRSVWAFFSGFAGKEENGWAFLRSSASPSEADSALQSFIEDAEPIREP